jgi:hypothetical protein
MVTEDLDAFLNDFGVTVTAGAVTSIGILDSPDDLLGGNLAISTEYRLTVKSSDFGSLKSGDDISVDSVSFKVRHFRLNDDGKFGTATLSKV